MLHRILMVGVLAGLIAGVATTALQLAWAVPLIEQAETYESAAGGSNQPTTAHHHVADHAHHGGGHGVSWTLVDDAPRGFWTLVSNIAVGVGAGFILAALVTLGSGPVGLRKGVLWGLAAFACIGIAPALGLPPELPGTAAAGVEARQDWWLLTVASTATGLALLVGRRSAPWRGVGVLALAAPHLWGAPQPEVHGALAPDALQREFIVAALSCSALFWLVLGTSVGGLVRRFGLTLDNDPGEPTRVGA